MGTVFRIWIKNFLNLIYPLSCILCKTKLSPLSDKPLCGICWERFKFNLPPFCRICGKHLPALPALPETRQVGQAKDQKHSFRCKDCQNRPYSFSQARSVCLYEGAIKECIHLFKYKSKLSLARPLSNLMIDFARKFLDMEKIDLVLAVPLHKVKFRQRQFNQAQLLARALSRASLKEMKENLLIKIKLRPAQVNLLRAERLKNVRGSFKVNNSPYLQNKDILLVDDVLTTGATANECARTLLEAGANRVEVFTLARAN